MSYSSADDVFDLFERSNFHRGPPTVEGVRNLFLRDPQAAKVQTYKGETLLHKCLHLYGKEMDLIQLLVEWFPECLFRRDEHDFLPIHWAIYGPFRKKDILTYMFSIEPQLIFDQDRHGRFPLHHACRSEFFKIPNDGLELLIVPEALQQPDNFGKCPLHYALEMTFYEPVNLRLLIDACPRILHEMIPDANGNLPLHNILRTRSSNYKTIQLLADKFPKALVLQNSDRQTPLMIACRHQREDYYEHGNLLSVIYFLIRQWPEQITTQRDLSFPFLSKDYGCVCDSEDYDNHDNNLGDNEDDEEVSDSDSDEYHYSENANWNGEFLPVMLVSKSTSKERVHHWLSLHPKDARQVGGPYSRIPLHYAVQSQSTDVLHIGKLLIDAYPEGATIQDRFGRLPLHYACAAASMQAPPHSNKRLSLVQSLLDCYSEGLAVEDLDGCLPWHYAACASADLSDSLYSQTLQVAPDLEEYLVPEEIRWDLIQIVDRDEHIP